MRRSELLVSAVALPIALAFPRPAASAASGGTGVALVTADKESHVVALDVSTGRVVSRIRVAPGPRSIESAFLTWAVVAHTASGRLSILHAPSLRLARVVPGFREPRYTAIHPARAVSDTEAGPGPIAYVTDSALGEVAVAILPAHAPPQHVAFRRRRVYVASGDDGTVRVHRPDGVLVGETSVPLGSYNVTAHSEGFGRLGAVTPSLGQGTVALLDERGNVMRVRRVSRAAHDACLVVSA